MLRSTSVLKKIKFDRARYSNDLSEAVIGLVHDAARAWLEAVLHSVDGTFPVYTGMAISSLTPISEYLQQGPGDDPTAPVSFSPVATIEGKTPALGEAAGRDFKIKVGRNQYGVHTVTFTWSSSVSHYEYNEYNTPPPRFYLHHPGPWHTLEAGQRAFEQYVEDHVSARLNNALKNYEYIYAEG